MSATTAIVARTVGTFGGESAVGIGGESKDRSTALALVSGAKSKASLAAALKSAGQYYSDPDTLREQRDAAREFAKVADSAHSAALTYALQLIGAARKAVPSISAAAIGAAVTGEDSPKTRKQWSRFDRAMDGERYSRDANKAGKRDDVIPARDVYRALCESDAKVGVIMDALKAGADIPQPVRASNGSNGSSESTPRKVTPGRVVSAFASLVDLVNSVDAADFTAEQVAAIASSMSKVRKVLDPVVSSR